MNIIVTVKQVPDTQEVRIDSKTGTLIRDGVPSIVNPDDKSAIEEALRIKDGRADVMITALSMGPPQAKTALREALSMGVDRAVLVCDRGFAGADTLATAYTLSMAIKKIKAYDLILCGSQAIDGDTAQVGPQLAECLGLPQITYADRISLRGDRISVGSNFGRAHRTIEAKLPALVTVINTLNTPRYKTMNGILHAFRNREIQVWNQGDLGLNPMKIGLNGSPTTVRKTFVPVHSRKGVVVEGDPDALSDGIMDFLLKENFLAPQ